MYKVQIIDKNGKEVLNKEVKGFSLTGITDSNVFGLSELAGTKTELAKVAISLDDTKNILLNSREEIKTAYHFEKAKMLTEQSEGFQKFKEDNANKDFNSLLKDMLGKNS